MPAILVLAAFLQAPSARIERLDPRQIGRAHV